MLVVRIRDNNWFAVFIHDSNGRIGCAEINSVNFFYFLVHHNSFMAEGA